MRPSVLTALAAACALTLGACGGDVVEPDASNLSEPPSATPTSESPSGKDRKPKDRGATPRQTTTPHTPDPSAGICGTLDPADVGAVIDATVHRGPVEDDSCVFADALSPTTRYVGVAQVTVASAGGSDAVAGTLTALVRGEPEAVPGVGERAYVAVGETAQGSSAAVGLVVVGDLVVSVGVPVTAREGTARAQVVELLELVTTTL